MTVRERHDLALYLNIDNMCEYCRTRFRRDGQCTASTPCEQKRMLDVIKSLYVEIVAKNKELERVRLERDALKQEIISYQGEIHAISSACDSARKERDAAMEDLKKRSECNACAHQHHRSAEAYIKSSCMNCVNFCNWQWVGVQEPSDA